MKSVIRHGREWHVAPSPDAALVSEIQRALPSSRSFAVVLARRGGSNWTKLIDPDLSNLHSPFTLRDIDKALSRLIRAIENEEGVFIHGDFDVDGLSGAAVLYQGLLPFHTKGRIKVDVGDRRRGHGLSCEFVRRAIDEGFALVVTADCGISNVNEIAALNQAGIDTIVTDHHLISNSLPPALAIIDPHRPDGTYPNRHLAGVGVAYKLICALHERLERPHPSHLLDLVALGTIADLVPLSEDGEVENRAMIREGFSLMAHEEGSSLGLRVLMDKLSVNPKKLTCSNIGYAIAPKLNAANRAGDPKVAFLLLTTGQAKRAEYLTEILLDYNRDREIAQEDLISQAETKMAEHEIDPEEDGIIILAGKHWNEGILGLVASNLADRHHVPTIILSIGDRTSRASCRSVEGFDIAACLEAHADLLLHHGGHRMAAGFSVSNEHLPELRDRLLDYVAKEGTPTPRKHVPNMIDGEITAGEIDLSIYRNLRSLAPYGPGNPAPLFLLKGAALEEMSLVGAHRQHTKGMVVQDGFSLPFIAFRMGRHIDLFETADHASVICRVGFDDWQECVQLEIVDLVTDRAVSPG